MSSALRSARIPGVSHSPSKDQEVINIGRSVISKVCQALAFVWDFITVDVQTCAICNIEYIINTVSVAIDCKKITLNYSNNLLSFLQSHPLALLCNTKTAILDVMLDNLVTECRICVIQMNKTNCPIVF